MKYKFWWLLCILFVILVCSCFNENRSANKMKMSNGVKNETKQNYTQIELKNKSIDKGFFTKSDTIIIVCHTIKNIGKYDLFISSLKSSCGCTGVTISSSVIKPGDTAIIKLNIDLAEKEGVVGIHTKFIANTKEEHHSLFTKMIVRN